MKLAEIPALLYCDAAQNGAGNTALGLTVTWS